MTVGETLLATKHHKLGVNCVKMRLVGPKHRPLLRKIIKEKQLLEEGYLPFAQTRNKGGVKWDVSV